MYVSHSHRSFYLFIDYFDKNISWKLHWETINLVPESPPLLEGFTFAQIHHREICSLNKCSQSLKIKFNDDQIRWWWPTNIMKYPLSSHCILTWLIFAVVSVHVTWTKEKSSFGASRLSTTAWCIHLRTEHRAILIGEDHGHRQGNYEFWSKRNWL